ncbi:MAG TPA: S8 family peptidase, partial [Sphingomicrobium sp.]
GVAFDSTIVMERADQPGTCASKDGCSFYDPAIASGVDAARLAGARVINLSLGGSAPGSDLIAALQRAVNAGIVIVIAAGNDATANPDPFALTPAQQFPGSVIIAGSLGGTSGNNVISDFSDRAGTGENFYLMALGYNDRAPDETGAQFLWSGTSFAAPTISGAVALMAQAFPNLTGKQIVEILFNSADDLGAPGIDNVYGHGALDIARAFQPQGATAMADSKTPVGGVNGDLPGPAGDANKGQSMGAVILDGYSRAYVLNLAKTLRQAPVDRPLTRSLQGDVQVAASSAGPVTVAMTVRQRHDLAQGFELERMNVGPDDQHHSRLIAATAIARLDKKTAVAFGFAGGAKEMERRLTGAQQGSFLVANDITGSPGFLAKRNGSMAVRHEFGGTGVTVSGETGDVWREVQTARPQSPYRLTSVAVDHRVGSNWFQLGLSRLEERETLLGGRMGNALGGGGSSSMFVDAEARHDFGRGWSSTLSARRGWTGFAAGKFQTDAYSFDLAKLGIFGANDRIGLRIAQPLRVVRGGFAMMLPTSYDYVTGMATDSFQTMSLRPNGREVDGELSYGSLLMSGNAWLGGNLFYRRDPGHIANSPNDLGGAIRFSLGF